VAQLRRDPIAGRWIVIDCDHPKGPKDFEQEDHSFRQMAICPFCPGRENLTPPEIDAVRLETKGKPGSWQVRTVPNKFPALIREEKLIKEGIGMFDVISGYGAHEVVIETPEHHQQMAELSHADMIHVLFQYQRRYKQLAADPRLKYIIIFKNYGSSAGATLEHSHSQIIGLPMVPKSVLEEIQGAEHYHASHGHCVFCDMLQQEYQDRDRLVSENNSFVSFCPFAPRYAFETWLLPKNHQAHFADLDEGGLDSLAHQLLDTLNRIKRCLSNPSYNLYLHTSPINYARPNCYHWHFEIIPKLTRSIGFEWGTGLQIVPTFPHEAARFLRNA
jgi:UDPglucose--hexose-1-phosphate uridylyltransferase